MGHVDLSNILLLRIGALAADANAALSESVAAKLPETNIVQQNLQAQSPFVLVRPNENGLFVAAHASHASLSHASSRY